jgi:large subunit ribosomal protein L17
MRHLRRTAKLGRTGSHRNAMLANLVCSLIKHKRITTTLAKAKATRPVAEKLLTLGKHAQAAIAAASGTTDEKQKALFKGSKVNPGKAKRELFRENEDVVHILFDKIAPLFKDRPGGYTRILRLGTRRGDVAQLAILEWVEQPAETTAVTTEAKPAEAAK